MCEVVRNKKKYVRLSLPFCFTLNSYNDLVFILCVGYFFKPTYVEVV